MHCNLAFVVARTGDSSEGAQIERVESGRGRDGFPAFDVASLDPGFGNVIVVAYDGPKRPLDLAALRAGSFHPMVSTAGWNFFNRRDR